MKLVRKMIGATDIALVLWIINLIEMGLVSGIFFKEYKAASNKFYLGVASFYILFILARICEIVRFALYPGTVFPYYDLNFLLKTGYTIFSYVGLTVIYYVLERYIFTGTKKIFTILVPIAAILSIWMTTYALGSSTYNLLFAIVIPIYAVILLGIVGMYIYLAIKSAGEVRRNSIMIIFGILLFELGILFALPETQTTLFAAIPLDTILILAPVFSIVGVILQIRGFKTSIS
jgi:hypothetical protein